MTRMERERFSLTLCLFKKRKTFMSLRSGEEFPFFDNFEGCCTRLDLGCIVLLSQHSYLFPLSELLWHFMLYFFSSFSHPALVAPCIILNNSDFLSFLCRAFFVSRFTLVSWTFYALGACRRLFCVFVINGLDLCWRVAMKIHSCM